MGGPGKIEIPAASGRRNLEEGEHRPTSSYSMAGHSQLKNRDGGRSNVQGSKRTWITLRCKETALHYKPGLAEQGTDPSSSVKTRQRL